MKQKILGVLYSLLLCFLALPANAQGYSLYYDQDYSNPIPYYPVYDNHYRIAYDYTVQFYPRWFTWTQLRLGQINRLGGPLGMGPEYKMVVAINDDTVYAQAFLDLSAEPQIITIPPYPNIYSVIILDVFGNIIYSASTPTSSGGIYALVGPNYGDNLPDGITPIKIPYNSSELILRIDNYSHQGVNLTQEASNFRAALQMQSLSAHQANPAGGQAFVAPLSNYRAPVKRMVDELIYTAPTEFLNTLQEAVLSPTTPLTTADRVLVWQFYNVFNEAKQDKSGVALSRIIQGVQAAHTAIVNNWRSNTGPTNWIHFNNFGEWGDNYLDRASATEYLQYGNKLSAAYYAHTFVDVGGVPLDGSVGAYTITFTQENMPSFSRFMSVTAYTPEDIELVANPIDKYVVASYTPGLVTAPDGSITIYVQPSAPTTAPIANWLPVPDGPFNLMFRVYGPEGNALLDGTYIPPAVQWGSPF